MNLEWPVSRLDSSPSLARSSTSLDRIACNWYTVLQSTPALHTGHTAHISAPLREDSQPIIQPRAVSANNNLEGMTSTPLEQLITAHRSTLLQLYTSISPAPQPLVNQHLDSLHQLVESQIAQQVQSITEELARVEALLTERWAKVTDWRVALGEPVGAVKTKEDGPLLTLVDEVDQVIQGMRSRMQQRGEAIVELQRRLSGFVEVVGREWLGVELEDWNKGWEGLDLRLERMSSLERECLRCEAEIVS